MNRECPTSSSNMKGKTEHETLISNIYIQHDSFFWQILEINLVKVNITARRSNHKGTKYVTAKKINLQTP